MTRERWQDSEKVKVAQEDVRVRIARWLPNGGLDGQPKNRDDCLDALCAAVAEAVSVPPEAASEGEVDEDDLCAECVKERATEILESGEPLCKSCYILRLESVCDRLKADMPVAPDDPAAVGRVAMLLRDYGADSVDCAKRIVAAFASQGEAERGEAYRCRHCDLPIKAHSEGRVRECLDALSRSAGEGTGRQISDARLAMLLRSAERYALRCKDRKAYAEKDAASFAEAAALLEGAQHTQPEKHDA